MKPLFLILAMSVGMLAQLHNPVSSEGKKQELEKIAERAANPPVIYDESAVKKMVKDEPNGPSPTMWPSNSKMDKWCTRGSGNPEMGPPEICSDQPTYHAEYSCPSVKGYRTYKLEDDSGETRCLHIPKSTKE